MKNVYRKRSSASRAAGKNRWYSGFKLAARGAAAYGAWTTGVGSSKYGWRKGGKVFKRMFGRRKGTPMGMSNAFSRLGSNRRVFVPQRTGSNRGPRLGSNPYKKIAYKSTKSFITPRFKTARQKTYRR